MEKPVCKYGAACYRKNSDHLKNFSHPGRTSKQDDDPPPTKKQKIAGDPLPTPSASDADTVSSPLRSQEADNGGAECSAETDQVKRLFLVELPEDFYRFWDFCKYLHPKDPSTALQSTLGLRLVGPYDVLAGTLKESSWEKCVLHSRHFYDRPEMTTVLSTGAGPGFHIGYFRDDPKTEQFLLVSNDSEKNCELRIEGGDIFQAVRSQIQSGLQDKGSNSEALKALESKLASWTSKEKLSPCEKSVKDLQRQRHKETLATTFNKLGIVVPYDKKTELGYRPLPMSDRELLKLLNRIASCTEEKKRDEAFEPLEEVITFVQFANDECDYGMGLELGLDLFGHGDPFFHTVLEHLLPLAYELLGREGYACICREHLKCRNKTPS